MTDLLHILAIKLTIFYQFSHDIDRFLSYTRIVVTKLANYGGNDLES
jgi:hypothetical protein